MENSKSSVDILSASQGMNEQSNCHPAWVPSNLNLADALTKHTAESMKTIMMYRRRKSWIIKFDDDFISARKQAKLRRQKNVQETMFTNALEEWCEDPFSFNFGEDIER